MSYRRRIPTVAMAALVFGGCSSADPLPCNPNQDDCASGDGDGDGDGDGKLGALGDLIPSICTKARECDRAPISQAECEDYYTMYFENEFGDDAICVSALAELFACYVDLTCDEFEDEIVDCPELYATVEAVCEIPDDY